VEKTNSLTSGVGLDVLLVLAFKENDVYRFHLILSLRSHGTNVVLFEIIRSEVKLNFSL